MSKIQSLNTCSKSNACKVILQHINITVQIKAETRDASTLPVYYKLQTRYVQIITANQRVHTQSQSCMQVNDCTISYMQID